VDGQAFIKLDKDDLIRIGLRLGPVVKIYDAIMNIMKAEKRPFDDES
jgi:hypothetical protein